MEKVDLGYNLYEKMSYEQDYYRQWLLSQPPEEILNHAYEYAMREDILMAMETEELTDAQAQALLGSACRQIPELGGDVFADGCFRVFL